MTSIIYMELTSDGWKYLIHKGTQTVDHVDK